MFFKIKTLTFNRLTLFLTGFALLLLLYVAQRVYVYQRSEFTHGVLLFQDVADSRFYEAQLELHYYIGMKEYVTMVTTETARANRSVVVRYLPNRPEKGHLYTFADFWLLSALWLLLPTMLWGAFVFAWLNHETERLRLIFRLR